jgi:aspartate-semialdehyde dehydrogenase
MLTRKAAAALAAGCTIVAHPSSETPLSALALAELGERAGLPAGVFNIVTGKASTIVGTMCEDARVRAMSFTGSSEIGRLIAAQSAPTMKRLVMELGGQAPLIVFADADLDRAVTIAVDAKFATSGQDCLAANRIYVQRPLYDRFCFAFAKRIEALQTGNGLAAETDIGPLMHERAVKKVEEHVADALAQGARCLTGGKRHPAGSLFYQPTLLAEVADDALIMREETFGPVAAVATPRRKSSPAQTPQNTASSPMSSPKTAPASCAWAAHWITAWSPSTASRSPVPRSRSAASNSRAWAERARATGSKPLPISNISAWM